MADKVVLVEIQYDTATAIKNLTDLTSAVEGEKVMQAKLKAELESGKISQTEYSKQVELSKDASARANTERKATIQLLGAEKGSVNEIKASIKQLTIERDKLNKTTAEGKKAYDDYNARIKDLKTSLKDAQGTSEKAGLSFKKMWEFAGGIGIAALAKKAFDILKDAAMSFFTATEEGMDFLERKTAGFQAGLSVLRQEFISLTKTIMDKFSESGEKTDIFGNVINKLLTVVGSGANVFKGYRDWVDKVTESMGKAKYAAEEYTLTVQQLEDAEVKLIVPRAKALEQLKEMQSKGRDETIAIKDRINYLDKAVGMVKEQGKIEVDEQNKRVAALATLKQNYIDTGREAQWTRQMEKDYQTEIAKAFNIQTENYGQTRRAESQLAALKKETNKESVKDSTDASLKKQELLTQELAMLKFNRAMGTITDEQYFIQLKAFRDKNYAETTEQYMALTLEEKKYNDEKAAIAAKASEDEIKRRGEAILAMAELKAQELEADQEKYAELRDAQITQADEELATKLEQKGILDEEIALAEEEHKARLIEIETEYQDKLREQRQKSLDEVYNSMQQIIAATQGMANKRVTLMADMVSKIATLDWKSVKTTAQAADAVGMIAAGLTSLITAGHQTELDNLEIQKENELALVGDNKEAQDKINKKYANKKAEMQKQQAKEEKTKAIIDATIATALGVVKALADPGGVLGIVLAALVGIMGVWQIASISNQPDPQFKTYAKGGVIGGRSHAQGGTKFAGSDGSRFEAEKGEGLFVLKKDATAEIAALSMLNESHGGRSWNSGAGSHLAEGGEAGGMDIEKSVDEAFQRTPIMVDVNAIELGLTNLQKVKNAGVI